MTPDVDIDLGQLLGAGTLTMFVMDWLKKTPLVGFIDNNTYLLNRLISIGVAIATASGIKMVSTGSLHDGGTMTITFPAITVIINTLIHASGQWGWQELLHWTRGNHVMNNQILALMQAAKLPAPEAK